VDRVVASPDRMMHLAEAIGIHSLFIKLIGRLRKFRLNGARFDPM
jgi:hypothetical protein